MNPEAEALATAKRRIIELQSQMLERILKMAVEVEKLTDIVTEREAREFLRVTCNMPYAELSTYANFASSLKGFEDTLRKGRASFPVVKALVSAEDESRSEILERMEIGARISTKDITGIRKRLKEATLTPDEVMARRNGRMTAAAARQQGAIAATDFQQRLYEFVREILPIKTAVDLCSHEIRAAAGTLRSEFEGLFGVDHRSPGNLKPRSRERDVANAYFALVHLHESSSIRYRR
ncbi:MAG: hypothetical protein O9352_24010 [Rhizobium sp.]|nr:hypothetical protein [Rhizobium sp.]